MIDEDNGTVIIKGLSNTTCPSVLRCDRVRIEDCHNVQFSDLYANADIEIKHSDHLTFKKITSKNDLFMFKATDINFGQSMAIGGWMDIRLSQNIQLADYTFIEWMLIDIECNNITLPKNILYIGEDIGHKKWTSAAYKGICPYGLFGDRYHQEGGIYLDQDFFENSFDTVFLCTDIRLDEMPGKLFNTEKLILSENRYVRVGDSAYKSFKELNDEIVKSQDIPPESSDSPDFFPG